MLHRVDFACWFGEKNNNTFKCKYIKHNFPISPYRFYFVILQSLKIIYYTYIVLNVK